MDRNGRVGCGNSSGVFAYSAVAFSCHPCSFICGIMSLLQVNHKVHTGNQLHIGGNVQASSGMGIDMVRTDELGTLEKSLNSLSYNLLGALSELQNA